MKVFPSVVFVLSAASLLAQGSISPVTEFVWSARGSVQGQTDGAVDQFLGIPYAAPPIADLRWKAPADPPHWSGVRDATRPGSACVQMGPARNGPNSIVGSEDCLYLNIYRPANAKPRQLLPVMIFIHGGSNQKGSGNDYDPTRMVAKTGIVVVTINYRLNVFGFLAMPSLDTEAGDTSSGNFGLLDQQAAMRWVRSNILAFGGNPLNITIAGESAGGIDVCANLISPAASGLFKKAIMESMYCPAASHDEALIVSAPVATALGCMDPQTAAACMRAIPPADVLAAAGPLSGEPGGGSGFNASPNFGNRILPLQALDALNSGKWNHASILMGSNHDELALVVGPALLKAKVKLPLSDQAYQVIVNQRFGSLAPSILNEYPSDRYPNPFLAYADLVTDKSPLGCAVSPLSQYFASVTPTFRYEFDDQSAPIPSAGLGLQIGLSMGAYHGSELQYLFKMTQLSGPRTTAQQELSSQMMQYWGNFVKGGDPNGPNLVTWPLYDAGTHRVLSLRPDGNKVIDNFDTDHHCAFWAATPAQQPN